MRVGRKEGYTTPDDASKALSPRYWFVVHGVAWGVVWIVLVFGVPWIAAIFADFGIPLGQFTVEVLWAFRSRALSTVFVLAVLAVDYVVLNRLARRCDTARLRLWAHWMLAAVVMLAVVIFAACAHPLLTIDRGLSG